MLAVAWMVQALHCSFGMRQGPKDNCKKGLLAVTLGLKLFVR